MTSDEPTAQEPHRDSEQSRKQPLVDRRSVIKVGGLAGTAALMGMAGCPGSSASSDDVEEITMLLTPGTPADARRRYKPVQNLLNGEVDGVDVKMKVPGSYSAIKPALES